MFRSDRTRLLFSGVLAILAGAVALATLGPSVEAWYLGRQLTTAPPDERAALLDRLGALGAAGLAPQFDAAVGRDPALAALARERLAAQLTTWRGLPPRELRHRLRTLAALLHARPRDLPGSTEVYCQDLATRLLAWPGSDEAVGRRRLVELLAPAERSYATAAPRPPAPPGARIAAAPALSAIGPAIAARPSATATSTAPALLPADPAVTRTRPAERPAPPAVGPSTAGTTSPPAAPVASAAAAPATARPVAFARPDWTGLATEQVLPYLGTGDTGLRAEAHRELARRGLPESQIALAARLVAADPVVRLAAVESLLSTPGVDPRPWLVWKSRDEDPRVRRMVASILLTSHDPGLRGRLAEMAATDPDPELRAWLTRIERPR